MSMRVIHVADLGAAAVIQYLVLRLTRAVDLIFGTAAALFLLTLMAVTLVDVLGRNLLNRPLTGALELTELLLFLIIFLMLPQVTLRNQHIVITLLSSTLGSKLDIFQRVLNAVLGFGLYSITGWQLWALAARSASYGDMTPTLQWPYAPFLFAMAVLSFLNAVAFLLSIANPSSDTEISVG
jgi:TRAP-type C4-dicarboxylate transport system permease small subunit